MPFMKGPAPIRRTLKYLEAGKIIFKDNIRIFSLNYNTKGDHHEGARKFVFWNLPQVQFKNPDVQVITFKNITPSPFITCYLENGKEILIDIDSKTREEVEEHLLKIVCKSEKEIKQEEEEDNVANFGFGCTRPCMCTVPGQVPCPAIIPVPKSWRLKKKEDE